MRWPQLIIGILAVVAVIVSAAHGAPAESDRHSRRSRMHLLGVTGRMHPMGVTGRMHPLGVTGRTRVRSTRRHERRTSSYTTIQVPASSIWGRHCRYCWERHGRLYAISPRHHSHRWSHPHGVVRSRYYRQ
ncbi:MAG: hypothetical protein QGH74_05810 [Candidatus Brocadiia bacterium]|nr:hypothetical protein [Candidatus Brocadiia bacterium]